MKHLTRNTLAALALVSGVLAGCEWGGGGDDNSWNDSNNIANFNGSYNGNGGYLVSDYTSSGSSASLSSTGGVSYTAYSESGGSTGVNRVQLQGRTSHGSVKPGSLTIVVAGISLTAHDNGDNTLSGAYVIGVTNLNATGHIEYDTGVWTLQLASPGLSASREITQYYEAAGDASSPSSSSSSGASGVSILVFNVQQSGNKLKMIDNNGSVYTGTMDTSRSTGNADANSQGTVMNNGDQVIAPFSASGKSASGMYVNMTGNFQGSIAGVSTVTERGANNTIIRKTSMSLTNRRIMGTWIEDGGKTGNISGVSPSAVDVTLGTVVTNTATL